MNDLLQIALVLLLVGAIAWPLGYYIKTLFALETTKLDKWFMPFERLIYWLGGIENDEMNWKQYAKALLFSNAILLFFGYLVLRTQAWLPWNPQQIANMEPTLAFNTATSFLTNTNLQHYSGESGLSYLSQMLVITMFMFTTPATGISLCLAFFRGLTNQKSIGNFYVDFVRAHTRLLLPLSFLFALLLVAQGVPQTLDAATIAHTLEGAKQTIMNGPIAALESIKHLGTNGGGFFGVNSAHPFENPTPITNVLEILMMFMIPAALPFTFAYMAPNRKQGIVLFATMSTLFLLFLGIAYYSEAQGNPALASIVNQNNGSLEGKEVRFGIAQSALFTTVTTAATTGTVNNMHDTLTPMGGFVPLAQMMLNCVFGGEGVGTMNVLTYALLAVFLSGLMVGRTPEYLGKKIEVREMKLLALVILIHPIIILIPSAIAFVTPYGYEAISNGGFHGISQVVYEFTSSAANNGSGFEGLADNTPFWNIATGTVMMLGRYLSMIGLLAVAGSLLRKKAVPATVGTFRTDNVVFATILYVTIFIVGALTFFPVLALGPIAEALTLK